MDWYGLGEGHLKLFSGLPCCVLGLGSGIEFGVYYVQGKRQLSLFSGLPCCVLALGSGIEFGEQFFC